MGRPKYTGPISVWDQLAVRELFNAHNIKVRDFLHCDVI